MIVVNDKTLRGSAVHKAVGNLMASIDHHAGLVLGQVKRQGRTNEIPMFSTLLDDINLTNAVVTADAMHCQGHMPTTWSCNAVPTTSSP